MDKVLIHKLQKLDTEKLVRLPMKKFANELVEVAGLFQSERDLKIFILEYIGITFREDVTDWPVRYYTEKEDLEDRNEDMLTDEYIQGKLEGMPKKKYVSRDEY